MVDSSQALNVPARLIVVLTLIASLFAFAPAAAAQQAECNGLAVTIMGTDSHDYIIGTDGDDVISLLGGDDSVESGDGDDTICDTTGYFEISTGDGNDTVITGTGELGYNDLHTGPGNDTVITWTEPGGQSDSLTYVYLGPGDDEISIMGDGPVIASGEDGNDLIKLTGRNATVDGGLGNDRIIGSNRGETLRGGPGNDILIGKGGDDVLYGEDGDDKLLGGTGKDELYGEDGDDLLKGGAQLDQIIGGAGMDGLYGGSGNDIISDNDAATIRGGKGADTITLRGKTGASTVKAGPGADRIIATGKDLELHGDGGPDYFEIEINESTVYGDAGHDEVIFVATGPGLEFFLGSGDDIHTEKPNARHLGPIEVSGGPGDDHMIGTQFDDTLRGNSGRDWFDGRAGNDILDGGKDNDGIAGGLGADVVKGGGDEDFCLLGHFDLVDVYDPEGIIGWEGPPDAGDSGDCENNWGETGYWIYRRDQLFKYDSVNLAYDASKISKNVYGWNFDLQPEGVNAGPLLNPGDSPESRFR